MLLPMIIIFLLGIALFTAGLFLKKHLGWQLIFLCVGIFLISIPFLLAAYYILIMRTI